MTRDESPRNSHRVIQNGNDGFRESTYRMSKRYCWRVISRGRYSERQVRAFSQPGCIRNKCFLNVQPGIGRALIVGGNSIWPVEMMRINAIGLAIKRWYSSIGAYLKPSYYQNSSSVTGFWGIKVCLYLTIFETKYIPWTSISCCTLYIPYIFKMVSEFCDLKSQQIKLT